MQEFIDDEKRVRQSKGETLDDSSEAYHKVVKDYERVLDAMKLSDRPPPKKKK
jgi:hypothetical protein